MKPFSLISKRKSLELKVKSRLDKIFKISFLCNKVKFDRASVVFCRHIICSSPVKLHERSYETSLQTLIGGNLGKTGNVSAGVLISIIAYQCKRW